MKFDLSLDQFIAYLDDWEDDPENNLALTQIFPQRILPIRLRLPIFRPYRNRKPPHLPFYWTATLWDADSATASATLALGA
jgi:hypothetical protein